MRTNNPGPIPKYLDSGIHQQLLVDAVQALDLAVLVGKERLPVEMRLADSPTKAF
jgi:hypothetical protein